MPTTCVSSSLRMGIMDQHPLKRLRMSCRQAYVSIKLGFRGVGSECPAGRQMSALSLISEE